MLAVAAPILLLFVAAAYGNSLENGFTWDDHEQIVMNPELRRDVAPRQLLVSDVWAFLPRRGTDAGNKPYYRPLQTMTYRVIGATAGMQPAVFHVTSVIALGVASILCLVFFWALTRQVAVAFAAAALFAVHPIHSEAVDWASALPDIGCTAFLLAALTLFLFAYGRPPEQSAEIAAARKLLLCTLSLVCFALALLWKEIGAVLPLLVAVYVFLFSSKDRLLSRSKEAALLSMPFWGILAAYFILRFLVLGHIATSMRNWMLSPLQVGFTAAHLIVEYWWKLLIPVPLNAYYVFSPVKSGFGLAAMGSVLLLMFAIVAIAYWARRLPVLAFTALWVFVALLPVMDFYAVGRNVFAERYLFLPSVGFCLFLAAAAAEAGKWIPANLRWGLAASVLVIAVSLCIVETRARNHDWKDDTVLFTKTLETSPDAPFVQNMVASTQKGDAAGMQSAETHYFQALALASEETPPDRLQMAKACEGLALIYSERADFLRAIDFLNRVRSIDPSDPEVDGEEGLIMARAGRWEQASQLLERAVAASHADENVLNALGIVAQQHTHKLDQAAVYFSRALAMHTAADEFSASVHNNLGAVYGEQGHYNDAILELRTAISIEPNDPEYRTNLAAALAAVGEYDAARSQLRTALTIAPGYPPALDILQNLPRR